MKVYIPYFLALALVSISSSLYGLSIVNLDFVEGNFSWAEAKLDAESKGGRLVVLDSQEKLNVFDSFLSDLSTWPIAWIGLTDEENEGTFKWINGEILNSHNFRQGEPNNANGFPEHDDEDHVAIWHSSYTYWGGYGGGKWNDFNIDDNQRGLFEGGIIGGYILETIPEPTTYALIIGALGFGFALLKRK